nr:immunoglobulin light chain junction region [Macaca mulatta]MOX07528.1 immunoglobulin light chain junction region [Macaca mulatta]MOX07555.1 immunoglobulin light chain junction region [Macaca mulatta]MOX07688.1 immunoglobulin light chain junction region [Macaca mulatta]MOX08240.1 immunoglobulin light chain junction region [Macaca mulatta]
CQEIFTF